MGKQGSEETGAEARTSGKVTEKHPVDSAAEENAEQERNPDEVLDKGSDLEEIRL